MGLRCEGSGALRVDDHCSGLLRVGDCVRFCTDEEHCRGPCFAQPMIFFFLRLPLTAHMCLQEEQGWTEIIDTFSDDKEEWSVDLVCAAVHVCPGNGSRRIHERLLFVLTQLLPPSEILRVTWL